MTVFNGYLVRAIYSDGCIREEWYNAPNPDNILTRIKNDTDRRLFHVYPIRILRVKHKIWCQND